MKHLLLASLITVLAIGTACGQAPEPEPVVGDGIQVHGHWTVTVTNPDGTIAAMHEFDNELTNTGKQMLPALLLGELSVANHSIVFGEQSNQNNWRCLEESPNQNQDNPDLPFYFRLVPATASRPMIAPDIGTKLVITASCTIAGSPRGNTAIDSVMVLIGTNESFNATKGQPTIRTENYISYEYQVVNEPYTAIEYQVVNEPYTVFEDQVVNENYIDTDGSTKTRQVTKKVEVTKTRQVTKEVEVTKARQVTKKIPVTKERKVADYQLETYPSSSASGNEGIYLTFHRLDEPISITQRQEIGVTVEISFS